MMADDNDADSRYEEEVNIFQFCKRILLLKIFSQYFVPLSAARPEIPL